MTNEHDIYRTAKLVIQLHGEGSVGFAAKRATELKSKSDEEGWSVWCRIEQAIIELKTNDSEVIH